MKAVQVITSMQRARDDSLRAKTERGRRHRNSQAETL